MPENRSGPSTPVLDLVQRGWDHLKHQRPLAARGCWQQALRIQPDFIQAVQAIAALEKANDLPLAARAAYRFRHADEPDRRARWEQLLSQSDTADLETASDRFSELAELDPTDSVARFNQGLCLAWTGQNLRALAALDRSARLDAPTDRARAADAWTIGELLRQGAGAESLADDLRYSLTIPWKPEQTRELLDLFPEIRRLPAPKTPGADSMLDPAIELYEWLDDPRQSARWGGGETPRTVLATVTIGRHVLRLSSPIQTTLEQVEERLIPRLDIRERQTIRREVTPLPIPFLDADVWCIRVDPEISGDRATVLVRGAVERYYENEWIHRPRRSLDGLSPLAAAERARRGDPISRAQLTAVIRVREQLGERTTAIGLYQGYPFDRLRHRLGIEPTDPDTVEPDDFSCAPADVLDRLEIATLDRYSLAEAAESAAGLRDDNRTARFTAELLESTASFGNSSLPNLVAACVRLAMARQDVDSALGWIERSLQWANERGAVTLRIWQAEILARQGQPALALEIYSDLLDSDPSAALLALDASETMLDNGHQPEAESLLRTTISIAKAYDRPGIEHQARRLMETLH